MSIATTARPATIRLSARLNSALNEQAKALKISKDRLIREALQEKLDDIQDLADGKHIMAEIKAGKRKTVTLEEVLQRNGL